MLLLKRVTNGRRQQLKNMFLTYIIVMADVCNETQSLGVVSLRTPQSFHQGTLVHAAEMLHAAGVAQGFQATHIHHRFQQSPSG